MLLGHLLDQYIYKQFCRCPFVIASYGKDTNAIFKSDKNNRGKCGLWRPTFPASRLFGRLQIAVWEFIMNSYLALRIVWDQSDCRKVFHLIDGSRGRSR